MDPIFYTFLGMGIGFIGSQVVMNNVFKQNKKTQQNQVNKKFLPSTPDIKKAFQQNQLTSQINRQFELNDQVRKIVKIQPTPVQLDTDSQFSLKQEQQLENGKQNQFNNSEHNTQPQTPNFQNKVQTNPNIKLFISTDQIQQIVTSPLILKQNKFSASQKNHPQTTLSISHSESSAQNSDKDE